MCQIDGVMLALWGFGENMRHALVSSGDIVNLFIHMYL